MTALMCDPQKCKASRGAAAHLMWAGWRAHIYKEDRPTALWGTLFYNEFFPPLNLTYVIGLVYSVPVQIVFVDFLRHWRSNLMYLNSCTFFFSSLTPFSYLFLYCSHFCVHVTNSNFKFNVWVSFAYLGVTGNTRCLPVHSLVFSTNG